MAGRRTNLALGVLLLLAVATGFGSMAVGTRWTLPAATIHGVTSLAIVILAPWKQVIVRRGWSRDGGSRVGSALLVVLTMIALGSGLAHSAGAAALGPLTMMQVHVGSGLAALAAGVAHYRRHPTRPRRTDWSRRTLIRTGAVAALAGVAWVGWEGALEGAGWRGAERRFTGSHEVASGRPERMPATVWFNDRVPPVDRDTWTVTTSGTARTVAALESLPQQRLEAALDCTSGWYSVQQWQGVSLRQLLPDGQWRSIEVTSRTGYRRRLPATDLDSAILALRVGDAPLTARHGAPVRLVVPNRRGFWWVKWVVAVEPSNRPWWLQLPFPAS